MALQTFRETGATGWTIAYDVEQGADPAWLADVHGIVTTAVNDAKAIDETSLRGLVRMLGQQGRAFFKPLEGDVGPQTVHYVVEQLGPAT